MTRIIQIVNRRTVGVSSVWDRLVGMIIMIIGVVVVDDSVNVKAHSFRSIFSFVGIP